MEKLSTDQSNKIIPVDFRHEELSRWKKFSELCEARLAKTCIVSQDYCNADRCFAKQIIIFAKGFI